MWALKHSDGTLIATLAVEPIYETVRQAWITPDCQYEDVGQSFNATWVVDVVSIRQARLALLAAGMLDDINAGIATMGPAAQIEWEYASEVRRDSALVAGMAVALVLTDEQLDQLFVVAAGL